MNWGIRDETRDQISSCHYLRDYSGKCHWAGSVIEPAVALAGYGDQNSQGSQAGTPSLTSGTPAPTPGPVRVKKVEADPAPNAPADSGTNSDATTVPAASQASAVQKRPPELQRALDEFRLQIGKLSGGANGKSMVGGRQNSLTGRLYENLRNDIMDAIPHQVRQAGGNKSLLRRNQYGATVSGPVRLPWLYDGRGRTFFSFSFEGYARANRAEHPADASNRSPARRRLL